MNLPDPTAFAGPSRELQLICAIARSREALDKAGIRGDERATQS